MSSTHNNNYGGDYDPWEPQMMDEEDSPYAPQSPSYDKNAAAAAAEMAEEEEDIVNKLMCDDQFMSMMIMRSSSSISIPEFKKEAAEPPAPPPPLLPQQQHQQQMMTRVHTSLEYFFTWLKCDMVEGAAHALGTQTASLLDLGCGMETRLQSLACVSHYVGVDSNPYATAASVPTATASRVCHDFRYGPICNNNTSSSSCSMAAPNSFDIVCAMNLVQHCFDKTDTAAAVFNTASYYMRDGGGYFIGITLDPSFILYLLTSHQQHQRGNSGGDCLLWRVKIGDAGSNNRRRHQAAQQQQRRRQQHRHCFQDVILSHPQVAIRFSQNDYNYIMQTGTIPECGMPCDVCYSSRSLKKYKPLSGWEKSYLVTDYCLEKAGRRAGLDFLSWDSVRKDAMDDANSKSPQLHKYLMPVLGHKDAMQELWDILGLYSVFVFRKPPSSSSCFS